MCRLRHPCAGGDARNDVSHAARVDNVSAPAPLFPGGVRVEHHAGAPPGIGPPVRREFHVPVPSKT